MRFFHVSVAILGAAAVTVPVCEPGVNMPMGDLPHMPIAAADETACAAACRDLPACNLFTYHRGSSCSYAGSSCGLREGCCWLKTKEVDGKAPAVNNCTCSGYVRIPKSTFRPSKVAPLGARNILYILVDDLRPELEAYGQSAGTHHSPHIKKLAESATVFDNAYCQISVCSPSRQSFLTGRRPDHLRVWNFIDHFRQADCGLTLGGSAYTGPSFKAVKVGSFKGGSGQCCSLCAEDARCQAWTYVAANQSCELKAVEGATLLDEGAISGRRGTFSLRASWTSMPQHFKNNGWLALSTGKIFHTEEGGIGNADPLANGPGMPPNEDPPSWSDGLSMQRVNDVANMWGCKMGENSTCPVAATLEGIVLEPETTPQFCDRVIADDAIVKLRLAAQNRQLTGQPFFLAAGFRKPHLDFRFPAPILAFLPSEGDVDVATHPTLDRSVPPIAHCAAGPCEPLQSTRQSHRAAVALVLPCCGGVGGLTDRAGF